MCLHSPFTCVFFVFFAFNKSFSDRHVYWFTHSLLPWTSGINICLLCPGTLTNLISSRAAHSPLNWIRYVCVCVRAQAAIRLLFTAHFSFNKASVLPLGPVCSRTPREDVNPGLICSHRTPTSCLLSRLISLTPLPPRTTTTHPLGRRGISTKQAAGLSFPPVLLRWLDER